MQDLVLRKQKNWRQTLRDRDTTPAPVLQPSISESRSAKALGRSGFVSESVRDSSPSKFSSMAAILLVGDDLPDALLEAWDCESDWDETEMTETAWMERFRCSP